MKNALLDYYLKEECFTLGLRDRVIARIRDGKSKKDNEFKIVGNIFILEFDFEKNLIQICKDFDFSDDPDVEMDIEDFINFLQNAEDIPK